MNHSASLTALLSAFARAYHTEHETAPVFADPIAKKLITADEYTAICEYILSGIDFFAPEKKRAFTSHGDALRYLVYTQIAPTPLARARFCEDSLKTAVLTGTKQYVILGTGMDSFAFREPKFMKNCKVFEADHPLTQSDKIERIQRAGLTIPDNVYFIPIDFRTDDLKKNYCTPDLKGTKRHCFPGLVSAIICPSIRLKICLTALPTYERRAAHSFLIMRMKNYFYPTKNGCRI